VVRYTDFDQGVSLGNPDIKRLTDCIAAFREAALDYFRR
jgi:hypothetical protein